MKYARLIFGQVIFVLSLAACGGTVATPAPTVAPTEAPTAAQVATTAPTEAPTPAEASLSAGPRTGDTAPDFTLPDNNGAMVHLADELKSNRAVVLVFYLDPE